VRTVTSRVGRKSATRSSFPVPGRHEQLMELLKSDILGIMANNQNLHKSLGIVFDLSKYIFISLTVNVSSNSL
jgi:hypothetical protein